MNIILLGANCTKKEIFSKTLSDYLKVPEISILKITKQQNQEINEKNIIENLKSIIQTQKFKKGFILKDYPQTIKQAQNLSDFMQVDLAINPKASAQEIISQINQTKTCSNCKATYHLDSIDTKEKDTCDMCYNKLDSSTIQKQVAVKELKTHEKDNEKIISFYKELNKYREINLESKESMINLETFRKSINYSEETKSNIITGKTYIEQDIKRNLASMTFILLLISMAIFSGNFFNIKTPAIQATGLNELSITFQDQTTGQLYNSKDKEIIEIKPNLKEEFKIQVPSIEDLDKIYIKKNKDTNIKIDNLFLANKKYTNTLIDFKEQTVIKLPFTKEYNLENNINIIESNIIIELDDQISLQDMKVDKFDEYSEFNFELLNNNIQDAQILFHNNNEKITGNFILIPKGNYNESICYNCSDCNSAINNSEPNDVITLNKSISITNSCIQISNKLNLTFNCLNNSINNSNNINTGFNITNSTNINITNCQLNNFNTGIKAISSTNLIIKHSLFLNNSYALDLNNVSAKTYNNYFNSSTLNLNIINSSSISLNTTNQTKTTIINTTNYGGNFWSLTNNSGYSQTCNDLNKDYICDTPYNVSNFIDYYPLTTSTILSCNTCEECNNIINLSNGNITLNLNSDININGTCIEILDEDNTIFDCNNHTITGNQTGKGIDINAYKTTIQNCNIRNFTNGINVGGANATINKITSTNNTGSGLYCRSGAFIDLINLTINNSNFNSNSYGNYIWDCHNTKIENTIYNHNNYALEILYSFNLTLKNMSVENNNLGLQFTGGCNNTQLLNSKINYNNLGIKYTLNNKHKGTLINNTFKNNYGYAFYFEDTNDKLIKNNYFENNSPTFFFDSRIQEDLASNKIYSNIFNESRYALFAALGGGQNYAKTEFANNTWLNITSTGYSQTCIDANKDSYCDIPYTIGINFTDNSSKTLQTCTDSIKNQDETDIDCGGSCTSCTNGKACLTDSDCTNNCINNVCNIPSTSSSGRSSSSITYIPIPEIQENKTINETSINQTKINITQSINDTSNIKKPQTNSSNNNSTKPTVSINETIVKNETNTTKKSTTEEFNYKNVDKNTIVIDLRSVKKDTYITDIINKKLKECQSPICKIKILVKDSKSIKNIKINYESVFKINEQLAKIGNNKLNYNNNQENIKLSITSNSLNYLKVSNFKLNYETENLKEIIKEYCVDYPCKVPLYAQSDTGGSIEIGIQ